MTYRIQTVGVDADDTLWDESSEFMALESEYVGLVSRFVGDSEARRDLRDIHMQLIESVGYGFEGYRRAMESYAEQVAPKTNIPELKEAIAAATVQFKMRPLTLKTDIEFNLRRLASQFSLILITKGNRQNQLKKLRCSGLGRYFDSIEIVPEKKKSTYTSIFGKLNSSNPDAAMIGNSIPSDISPALAAGAFALHVPHPIANPHDEGEAPFENPRYFQFPNFGCAVDWLMASGKRKDPASSDRRLNT